MAIEIKVPVLPESVSDATIAKWYKKPGEAVKRDEHLLDIETDKVVLEVVAPEEGSIETILKKEGDTVKAEEVVAQFKAGSVPETKEAEKTAQTQKTPEKPPASLSPLSPSVRRLVSDQEVDVSQIQGTGKGGRITKEDLIKTTASPPTSSSPSPSPKSDISSKAITASNASPIEFPAGERVEKRVPMSRLRARIAERLLQAQQNAAILTTFNEINMKPVMDLRQKYKDIFEKTHGVRLGFMSFFTMAAVEALKRFPVINASIDGNDIIYHSYYDIGIAVSSPRGLVVPVIRDAANLDMAQIEKQIAQFGQKAKEGQLTIEEISGGTFTISNGGVFGSLMSTPILNPPQSAILGMHKIEERPIVENGGIIIRPMMYVAMSYDHRIIDGAESVRFLVCIKELLEDPARFLLEI
jgi:2-oxoglutarate dehydrogenase E2 component (dihydrolipoamide succinyltransferase)